MDCLGCQLDSRTVSDNRLSFENLKNLEPSCYFIQSRTKVFLLFFLFHSDDYLKILQGGRKIRKLSGVYRYSLFGWGNNDDDDCDDDDKDGEDGEEGEDDEYVGEDRSKRFIFPVQRFPSPVGNRLGFPTRSRIGASYVTRVLIPGTGELISIVFKSDDDDVTEKGFEAMYRVRPGVLMYTESFLSFYAWN